MRLDYSDNTFTSILNKILSGFLPHNNFNAEGFIQLYTALTQRIKENEMHGTYNVFRYILHRFYILSLDSNTVPTITEDRFKGALETIVFDMVTDKNTDMYSLMAEDGESFDVSLPTSRDLAAQTLFAKTMQLYKECFSLQCSTEDALNSMVEFDEAIKRNYIDYTLICQQQILTTGLQLGRKFYHGGSGWLEYISSASKELSDFSNDSGKCLECNTYSDLTNIEKAMDRAAEPLTDYGIPNLDDETPILQHRLAVLIGRENVGKTKVMTHFVAKLIIDGVKPYIATGETTTYLYFFQVLSSYIYQKYSLHIPPNMLTEKNVKLLDKDEQQVVNTAKYFLMNSGMLIDDSLSYDTVIPTFVKYYNTGCRAFFIDHSQSLKGRAGRNINELVTSLALDCREFKNNYPVYVCVLSHPSAELKDILQKNPSKAHSLQVSPTAQSSTLSIEADEIFILYETELLTKQQLLGWITYKRRGPKIDTIFIRKMFHVSSFLYSEDDQAGANAGDVEDITEALNIYEEDLEEGLDVYI